MHDFYPPSRLILFTRYPEVGKTKTRLIPYLGAEQAACLQRQMTEHIIAEMQRVSVNYSPSLEIHFAGGNRDQMATWLGDHLCYCPQSSGDLGMRMSRAFSQGFQDGMQRVVMIGADCPDVTSNLLAQAFQSLEASDIVLGPALDGGYYLIGLSETCCSVYQDLFQGIEWGTSQVFDQTVAIARHLNLSFTALTPLSDIDRPEDLAIWDNIARVE